MAIQPTRPEAYDTGTLNQYAHIYDVQAEEKRARIAEETEEAARIAADDAEKQARIEADDAEKQARIAADDAEKQARIAADDAEKQARIAADDALGKRIDAFAVVQGSDSITITDGVAKVNPSIFGDGLATTDGKVSVDTGFVGEHLAGDALYYDTTNGLMVKTGTGLHIDNDTLSVDQDTLPLASADNRGTVKVGSGLAIAKDGTLSVDQNTLPLASTGNRGTVKVGSGLAIAKDGTLSANVTTMEYRKASYENITCDGMTLTDYVYLANTSYPKYDVTYYGQATKAFASGTKVTVDIATNTDTFNSYGCVEMSVNGLTLAIDSVSLDENGDRLKQAVFSVSKAIGIGDYVRFKLYF